MKNKFNLRFTKYFIYCLAPFLFFNCGETKNNSVEIRTVTTLSANSIKPSALINDSVQKLISLFKTNAGLPFSIDTAFINKANSGDSLGTREIILLSKNVFIHELSQGLSYDLEKFYHIDSLKAEKKYLEWIKHMEIGMTKFSNAYALKKIQLNENTLLLIWSLCSSSYEACPYSVESDIYFTAVYKNNITQSFLLGQTGTYGDPPVAMECTITGILNADGKFSLKLRRMNEDMDESFQEITKEEYEFIISDGEIKLINEKKHKAVKSKRPKEKD